MCTWSSRLSVGLCITELERVAFIDFVLDLSLVPCEVHELLRHVVP